MMEKVEQYATLYDLPRKLEDSIKLYYTFQYKKKVGSSEMVMKNIPKALKIKLMVRRVHSMDQSINRK